jgi:hypothetical protein
MTITHGALTISVFELENTDAIPSPAPRSIVGVEVKGRRLRDGQMDKVRFRVSRQMVELDNGTALKDYAQVVAKSTLII